MEDGPQLRHSSRQAVANDREYVDEITIESDKRNELYQDVSVSHLHPSLLEPIQKKLRLDHKVADRGAYM